MYLVATIFSQIVKEIDYYVAASFDVDRVAELFGHNAYNGLVVANFVVVIFAHFNLILAVSTGLDYLGYHLVGL